MFRDSGTRYQIHLNRIFEGLDENAFYAATHRYLRTQDFARLLFYSEIYQEILSVQGDIHLLGCADGSTLFILAHLAEILEPLNTCRQIIAFDLFQESDETYYPIQPEDSRYYISNPKPACTSFQNLCRDVDEFNACTRIAPHPRIQLIKGNAITTYQEYSTARSPLVSLLLMHIELYEVEKTIYKIATNNLHAGSLICSSTLGYSESPGVKKALAEIFDLSSINIKRSPLTSKMAYFSL